MRSILVLLDKNEASGSVSRAGHLHVSDLSIRSIRPMQSWKPETLLDRVGATSCRGSALHEAAEIKPHSRFIADHPSLLPRPSSQMLSEREEALGLLLPWQHGHISGCRSSRAIRRDHMTEMLLLSH